MDERLWNITHSRPRRLRREDLPDLTRAIIAVIRKRGTIGAGHVKNTSYVLLRSEEAELIVLKEDWAKILPFIQDGSFSPQLTPVAACAVPLHPVIAHGETVIDLSDRLLFLKILGILQQQFTDVFPTSEL